MKILIPVDGSVYSDNAVAFVASRTTLIGQDPEVVLLNVQPPLPARASRLVSREALSDYYEDESEKAFKAVRNILKKSGMRAEEVSKIGTPAEVIAEIAEEQNVDLLIMGSHGRSALKGLLFGSVTNAVLALTKVPLLMLRDKSAPEKDALNVGIAVDGSDFGTAAVNYAVKQLPLFGGKDATFHIINTVSDYAGAVMPDMTGMALPALSEDEVVELQKSEFAEAVNPVLPLFEQAGVKPKEVCLVGNPGDEIAAYCKKRELDILVMGSHGYGRFKSAVMGSTATRIASIADIPLLIIRK